MTSQRSFGQSAVVLDGDLTSDSSDNSSAVSAAGVENTVTTSSSNAGLSGGYSLAVAAMDVEQGPQFTSVPDFYEKYLDGGTEENSGPLTQQIGLVSGYQPMVSEWETNGQGVPVLQGTYGYLSWDSSGKKLYYTLTTPADQSSPISASSVFDYETFYSFVVINSDNDIITGDLSIKVYDDTPTVDISVSQETVKAGEVFEADLHLNYGADGAMPGEWSFIEITDQNGGTATIDLDEATSGEPLYIKKVFYGTLNITEEGKLTLDTTGTEAVGKTLSMQLFINDADGPEEYFESETVSFTIAEGNSNNNGGPGAMPEQQDFYEKYLEKGSESGQGPVTQEIALPEGSTPDVTGWTQVEGGYTFAGSYGTLTWNTTTSKLEYTLTTAPQNTPGTTTASDEFTSFKVLDAQNVSHDRPFSITIHDDSPFCSIHSDQSWIAVGDTLNGTWSGSYGADGQPEEGYPSIEFFNAAGESTGPIFITKRENFSELIFIEDVYYGTILVGDGTFAFYTDIDECEVTSDTLRIVISFTDADGTASTASFTARLGGEPPTPGVEPGPMPDQPEFYEKYLEKGTDSDNARVTQEIALPEGSTPDLTGWDTSGNLPTLQGSYGILTWDASTQTLEYTLTAAPKNTNGADTAIEEFSSFKVLNDQGTSYDRPFSITIHDDVPICALSSEQDSITGGETLTGTWNVDFGADGQLGTGVIEVFNSANESSGPFSFDASTFSEGISINGVYYGHLSMGDGTFAFNSEHTEMIGSDTVRLVISFTDGDGSPVTAEFTAGLVNEPPDPGVEPGPMPAQSDFYEKYLEQGTENGGGPVSQEILLPEGSTPDLTGWAGVGTVYTLQGDYGFLTWNATAKALIYTLTDAPANPEGSDAAIERFEGFKVLNDKGTSYDRPFSLTIFDDAPTALLQAPDTDEIEPGQSLSGSYEYAMGADGFSGQLGDSLYFVISVDGYSQRVPLADMSPVTTQGGVEVGYLRASGGTYTFEAAPEAEPCSVSIQLVAIDSDHDQTLSESVNFEITAATPTPTVILDAIEFNEAHLDNGTYSDPAGLVHGFRLEGDWTADPAIWTNNGNGSFTRTIDSWLKLDLANGNLTCTLLAAQPHAQGADALESTIYLGLKDAQGKDADVRLPVTLLDDSPTLDFTADTSIMSGDPNAPVPLTGRLDWNFGADGETEKDALVLQVYVHELDATLELDLTTGSSFDLTHDGSTLGTFVIEEDGYYSFQPTAALVGQVDFTLRIADNDADAKSVTISAEAQGSVLPPTPLAFFEFSEKHLQDGTSPDIEALTQTLPIPAGYSLDLSDGDWQVQSDDTYQYVASGYEHILLVYSPADGLLSCTLTGPTQHRGAEAEVTEPLEIPLTLTGPENMTLKAYVSVTVEDDIPELAITPETGVISQDEALLGIFEPHFGADGQSEENPLVLQVTAQALGTVASAVVIPGEETDLRDNNGDLLGRFLLTENGDFTFTPATGIEGELDFAVTITDGDGDSASGYFSVTVEPSSGPIFNFTLSLDEADLANGNPNGAVQSMNLPVGYTLDTTGWDEDGQGGYTLNIHPALTLIYTSADNVLTCTLNAPLDHSGPNEDDSLRLDGFELNLLNPQGNPVVGQLGVTVIDDVPEVSFSADKEAIVTSGPEAEVLTGHLDWNPGADGGAEGYPLLAVGSQKLGEGEPMVIEPGGAPQAVVINGETIGTFQLDADWQYTFTPAEGLNDHLVFTVTGYDTDGDAASANFSLLARAAIEAVEVQIVLEESGLPDGTSPGRGDVVIVPIPEGLTVDTGNWRDDGSGARTISDDTIQLRYDGTTLVATLTSPVEHADLSEALVLSFGQSLSLRNEDGQEIPLVLSAKINDDQPEVAFTAEQESISVQGGDHTYLTGNIGIEFGADGPAGEDALNLTVYSHERDEQDTVRIPLDEYGRPGYSAELAFGTITFEENGRYTFVPSKDITGRLDLGFSAVDSDGDKAQGSVSVVVLGGSIPLPPLQIDFDESKLPTGTDPLNSVTVTMASPAAGQLDTTGWATSDGIVFVIEDDYVSSQYNADTDSFTFTMLKAYPKAEPGDSQSVHTGPLLTFTDTDGNKYTVSPEFVFHEDAPDIYVAGSGTVQAGEELEQTFIISFGADAEASENPLTLQVTFPDGSEQSFTPSLDGDAITLASGDKNYGAIRFTSNLNYIFTAAEDAGSGTLAFKLTAVDSDGDSTSAEFSLTVSGGLPPELEPVVMAFEEAHLETGTDYTPGKLQQSINLPEGYSVVADPDLGWTGSAEQGYTLQGECGRLVLDPDGTLTYFFETPKEHTTYEGRETGITMITVTDGDGLSYELPVTITVTDDAPLPVLEIEPNQVMKGGEAYEASWSVDFGADGRTEDSAKDIEFTVRLGQESVSIPIGSASDPVEITINGVTYGTVSFTDNTYQFTAATVEERVELYFSLTAYDADGASGTSKLPTSPSVIIEPGAIPPMPVEFLEAFEESALPWGTDPDADGLTRQVQITDGWTIQTDQDDWTQDVDDENLFYRDDPGGRLTYDISSNQLSYTLTGALDHSEGNVFDLGTITLSNGEEYTVENALSITVNDDAPRFGAASAEVNVDPLATINGAVDFLPGADFAQGTEAVVFEVQYGATPSSMSPATSLTVPLNGEIVNLETALFAIALRYNPDTGEIEYQATNQAGEDGDKEILILRYADEDGSDTSLTITHRLGSGSGETLPEDVLTFTQAFDEANLAWGTSPDPDALVQEIILPDVWRVDTTGQTPETDGNETYYRIEVSNGVLYYLPDSNTLRCEITGSFDQTEGSTFTMGTVPLVHDNGDTISRDITITVNDDAPEFGAVSDETSVPSLGTLNGFFELKPGADIAQDVSAVEFEVQFGPSASSLGSPTTVAVPLDGTVVTLTTGLFTIDMGYNSDTGRIEYQATNTSGEVDDQEILVLKYVDSDGSGTELSITHSIGEGLGEVLPEDILTFTQAFDEANLAWGTSPDPDALVQEITLPGGWSVDTTGLTPETEGAETYYKIELGNGVLYYLPENNILRCEITGSFDQTEGSTFNLGSVPLVHDNGDTVSRDITITVNDDGPEFGAVSDDTGVPLLGVLNGFFELKPGADIAQDVSTVEFAVQFGPDASSLGPVATVTVPLDGTAVTLTTGLFTIAMGYNSDTGRIEYQATNTSGEVGDQEILVLKYVDSDGSIADLSITHSISESSGETLPNDVLTFTQAYDEANLAWGTSPNPEALVQEISIPNGWTVDTTDQTPVTENGETYYKIELSNGVLYYLPESNLLRCEITGSFDQTEGSTFNLGSVTLLHDNGDTISRDITITVNDDGPEFGEVSGETNVDPLGTLTGSFELKPGADIAQDVSAVEFAVQFGPSASSLGATTTVSVPLDGTAVSLTTDLFSIDIGYNSDTGRIEYQAINTSGNAGDQEVLVLKYVDDDGSSDSLSITHSINTGGGETLPMDILNFTQAFDEANLAWGTSPDPDALVQEISIPAGWRVDTTGQEPESENGETYYKTAINGGMLYYLPESNILRCEITGSFDQTEGSTFNLGTIPLVHDNGDTLSRDITISVRDDEPEFGAVSGATNVDPLGTLTGSFELKPGADIDQDVSSVELEVRFGPSGSELGVAETVTIPLNGTAVTLTTGLFSIDIGYNLDTGRIEYQATNTSGEGGDQEVLVLAYKDNDGSNDSLSITHSINEVIGETLPNDVLTFTQAFDEANLAWGTNPDPDALMQEITIPNGWSVDTSGLTPEIESGQTYYTMSVNGGVLYYLPDTNTLLCEITGAFDQSNGSVFNLGTVQLVHDKGDIINRDITITVNDDEPILEILSGNGNDTLSANNVYTSSGVLAVNPGADADPEADTITLQLSCSAQAGSGAPDQLDNLSIVLPKGGSVAQDTLFGKLTLSHDPDNGQVTYSYVGNHAGSGVENLSLAYMDADGSEAGADFRYTFRAPIDPGEFEYSGNSVYNPGYDNASMFGSFQTSYTSMTENWISGNAAWVSVLPAGMLPFPTDPALEGMTNDRAIRLQSSAMSARNVDKFIGTENSIVDILNDLGIETNARYVSDVYNSRLGLTSKEFSSQGGEIVFNWTFSGGAAGGESDAAFWVLMDGAGNIVDSGTIAHLQESASGVQYENGVTRIQVPYTAEDSDYRLVLGTVDGGSANSSTARLYINVAVMQEGNYLFSGNIYTDPTSSEDGVPDLLNPYIESVTLADGTTVTFNNGETIGIVELEEGILSINRETGDYKFVTHDGKAAGLSTEIIYHIVDDNQQSGEFYQTIALGSPVAYDNVAIQEYGYENVERLGAFESMNSPAAVTGNGWYSYGSVYTGRSLIHADTLPVPTNDLIDANTTGPNSWVRLMASSNMTNIARQTVFGTTDSAEITNILNDIGIQGDNFGYRNGSTGIGGTVMQKTFSTNGGSINFGWSFYTGAAENDAAFWMLKDSAGNIVQSGVLHQGPGKSNGLETIDIPTTATDQNYTLVLGALNVGATTGLNPLLYVSNILLVDNEYYFKGNVLTDPGPDGLVDITYDDTKLASVTYGEDTRYFDEGATRHVFETSSGTLTIDWQGNYYFAATDGAEAVTEQFQYTLVGADPDNVATLTIQQTPSKVFDQAPVPSSSGDSELLGAFDQALSKSGWEKNLGSITTSAGLPTGFEVPPSHEALAPYSDSQYMRITGAGTMPVQQWTDMLGDSRGHLALGELLDEIGAEGDVWRYYAPKGSFASNTFESSGGQVVFDWSFGGRAQADKDYDAAFWILKDSSGKIIDKGLLSQLLTASSRAVYEYDSGVCSIDIPHSSTAESYTLTIGTVQMGYREYSYSQLYVGSVVLTNDTTLFAGNLLTDASLQGQLNLLNAEATLSSVDYQGTTYTFDANGKLVIETADGGIFSLQSNGSYSFEHPDGNSASVVEDLNYTVIDATGQTDTGTLYLRSDEFRGDSNAVNGKADYSQEDNGLLITSPDNANTVYGSQGDDIMYGNGGNEELHGNAGNDVIHGGAGNDKLYGDDGNDTLFGGSGNDLLVGGDGNDLLYGGSGDNTLYGGAGSDTFAWKHLSELNGTDTIMDFSVSEGDKLSFADLLAGQTLDSFFEAQVSDLSLQLSQGQDGKDLFTFSIQNGPDHKDVVIELNPSDSGYGNFRSEYAAISDEQQAHELLTQFLINISS